MRSCLSKIKEHSNLVSFLKWLGIALGQSWFSERLPDWEHQRFLREQEAIYDGNRQGFSYIHIHTTHPPLTFALCPLAKFLVQEYCPSTHEAPPQMALFQLGPEENIPLMHSGLGVGDMEQGQRGDPMALQFQAHTVQPFHKA